MNTKIIVTQNLAAFLSSVAAIPPEEITSTDSLDTLGVDSAAIVSLAAHLEEEYGVVAETQNLSRATTLDQIADFVCQSERLSK